MHGPFEDAPEVAVKIPERLGSCSHRLGASHVRVRTDGPIFVGNVLAVVNVEEVSWYRTNLGCPRGDANKSSSIRVFEPRNPYTYVGVASPRDVEMVMPETPCAPRPGANDACALPFPMTCKPLPLPALGSLEARTRGCTCPSEDRDGPPRTVDGNCPLHGYGATREERRLSD